jgi:hypothetical protein
MLSLQEKAAGEKKKTKTKGIKGLSGDYPLETVEDSVRP